MSEDRSVTDLVARARNGDKRAWDDLVERYAPLVWSICRRHYLSDADAGDVQQNVWLQLVSQLDKIRNPAALPGWLATTRRECGRLLRAARAPLAAAHVLDAEIIPHQHAEMADQELLTAERLAQRRVAFGLQQFLLRQPGLLVRDHHGVRHMLGGARSPRRAQDPDAFPPGRGGQPAGKRGRVADLVQPAHELQPDGLLHVLGVGTPELVPAAD